MHTTTIERVTAEEFSERGFYERNRPAIIANALAVWDVEHHWTTQHLARVLEGREVPVSVSEKTRFDYHASQDPEKHAAYSIKLMDFPSVVRRVMQPENSEHVYAMAVPISEKLPELLRYLAIPRWIQAADPTINLWFGSNTVTPLHCDLTHNFFAQVSGSKRFIIFAPEDSDFLYPYDVTMSMPHISHVDAANPDLLRHPRAAHATPIELTINAGELLFLPAFWWHQVESMLPSISVNFWWWPDFDHCVRCRNAFRTLYRSYCVDKLAQYRTKLLEPSNHDLLSAAEVLLAAERIWPAAVLTLAAYQQLSAAFQEADSDSLREGANSLERSVAQGEDVHIEPSEVRELIRKLRRTQSASDRRPESAAVRPL